MTWIDWGILLGKVVIVFVGLLVSVLLFIWMERKVIADLQTRSGPMRAGPRGVLLSLADGLKLFFKEAIQPTQSDPWVYRLAPIFAVIPGFLAFVVVPFGPSVHIFGRTVGLQLADLSVGVLWVLAMTSIGVYTVVLAGWSSGSNYPLLGGVRSSAQMISYEVAMGLSLVALLMFAATCAPPRSSMRRRRSGTRSRVPRVRGVPHLCARGGQPPPFDLAEAESELVAGSTRSTRASRSPCSC